MSDWDLIAAAKNGDDEAFCELWRNHRRRIRNYVKGFVADWDTADDLTSETFLRAWKSLDSVEDQGRDVLAWFYRIARNLALDLLKSARHNRTVLAEDHSGKQDGDGKAWLAEIAPTPGSDTFALDGIERGVVARRLSLYVAQLPHLQRECLRLRYTEELSTTQVAQRLGRDVGAAKAIQHRAVERLFEMLAADGYLRSDDCFEQWSDAA